MAVSFATPTKASANNNAQETKSISEIILGHFDAYQRECSSNNGNGGAIRATAAIRDEISQLALSACLKGLSVNDDGDGDEENDDENTKLSPEESDEIIVNQTANVILRCMDSAMLTIHEATNSKSKVSWNDSVTSIFELVASLACSSSNGSSIGSKGKKNDGTLCKAVVQRAIQYSLVEKDAIRTESCNLLGMCVGHLVEGNKVAASILKGKGNNKKGSSAASNKAAAATTATAFEQDSEWKLECLLAIAKAIQPRLTDKIAKVRSSAITASSYLFSSTRGEYCNTSSDFIELVDDVLSSTMVWLTSNDSSSANRALAVACCPISMENIPYLIERVKDVDGKVREAALDTLRKKVDVEDLTEDQKVEILGAGLTKRCASTHAKTVELLCTHWMKHSKFDPIAFLSTLNPVLNENISEMAAREIIHVASLIDCESLSPDKKGVELVRKQFGSPEIRSFQQSVFQKMSIVPQHENEENEQKDNEDGAGGDSIAPAMALFLRVKCALTVESTTMSSVVKSDTISDIITDIPTLCNLLNTHLDKLIEFNNRDTDEDDDMDEEEAGAYEDDQNFICLQLIHMARASELQEEGSRRHFISIMRSMLSRLATPDDLVEACVKAMAAAHDTEAQFLQTISEILVDVEDDDTFVDSSSGEQQDGSSAVVIVRQMRVIAILSIVLENLSGHMMSNPILEGFRRHLVPAITSNNAVVREYGVGCLSKFALLCDQSTVMERDMPLLMQIASQANERVEVRAQAALALCDLALIHDRMLSVDENGENSFGTFQDMLLEMLGHSKPGIVIIAAEITAKLLLAGCFHDPKLVAWLLAIYFDSSITELNEEDEDTDGSQVKEVGSPIRLQQLLSIFFPTYSMSSLDANDAIMASVTPILSIVNNKLGGKNSPKVLSQWPIAKMIEYICYTVDLADKNKNDKDEGETDVMDDAAADQVIEPLEDDPAKNNDVCADDEKENNFLEASSTLLASIKIAEFLSSQSASAPPLYIRTLAKILASACIDVDTEDKSLLSRLKSEIAEVEYAINDGPALAALEKVSDLLEDIELNGEVGSDDEEEESVLEEEEEQDEFGEDIITDAMEKATLDENEVEKENSRLSTGSMGSTSTKQSEGGTRRSSRRTRLAAVN